MKSFAKMIKPYYPSQYIAATEVGTTELDMAVFAHEIGDMRGCTGKPQELGGIPHELGTTGYGVSVALKTTIEFLKETKRGECTHISLFLVSIIVLTQNAMISKSLLKDLKT